MAKEKQESKEQVRTAAISGNKKDIIKK